MQAQNSQGSKILPESYSRNQKLMPRATVLWILRNPSNSKTKKMLMLKENDTAVDTPVEAFPSLSQWAATILLYYAICVTFTRTLFPSIAYFMSSCSWTSSTPAGALCNSLFGISIWPTRLKLGFPIFKRNGSPKCSGSSPSESITVASLPKRHVP